MTKAQKQEQANAIVKLRGMVAPGETVWTILESVSRSGMSRTIRVVLIKNAHGEPAVWHPNYSVALAIGARPAKRGDGVVVGGCGMDMGFHVVYSLSRALYPDGFGCIGEGCPSNDHSNGDRDYTPHEDRSGACDVCKGKMPDAEPCEQKHGAHWHRDGGYALRHRWL